MGAEGRAVTVLCHLFTLKMDGVGERVKRAAMTGASFLLKQSFLSVLEGGWLCFSCHNDAVPLVFRADIVCILKTCRWPGCFLKL